MQHFHLAFDNCAVRSDVAIVNSYDRCYYEIVFAASQSSFEKAWAATAVLVELQLEMSCIETSLGVSDLLNKMFWP